MYATKYEEIQKIDKSVQEELEQITEEEKMAFAIQ